MFLTSLRPAGVMGDESVITYDLQQWVHSGGGRPEPFDISSAWLALPDYAPVVEAQIAGIVVGCNGESSSETGATSFGAYAQIRTNGSDDEIFSAVVLPENQVPPPGSEYVYGDLMTTQPNGEPWTLAALNTLEVRTNVSGEGHAGQRMLLYTAELVVIVYGSLAGADVVAELLGGDAIASLAGGNEVVELVGGDLTATVGAGS